MLYVKQEPSQIPPVEAGLSRGAQAEFTAKQACLQARQLRGQRLPFLLKFFPFFKTCSVCLCHISDTPVLPVGKSPRLTHDGSQISTLCRKGEGAAVAAVKKWGIAC